MKALADCPGDIVILGAGGKMGPTLAAMARRASSVAGEARRVIAVSRFSSRDAELELQKAGVETIRADLLDPAAVQSLPHAPNVVFMAGQKFGTSASPAATWAMNTIVPAYCAERYRDSRIVAFSTGNVYPLVAATSRGACETQAPAPVGEYAQSCLGRERVFEFFAASRGTRVVILRLNYAIEPRYGVLTDLAVAIAAGEPISLDMGYVNVIWQGDANRIALESLPHASAPPFVINVAGHDVLSVRDLAERMGQRLGRAPRFAGTERKDALLSDSTKLRQVFTPPEVSVDAMLDAVAEWIRSGKPVLGKPTHFQTRDGSF